LLVRAGTLGQLGERPLGPLAGDLAVDRQEPALGRLVRGRDVPVLELPPRLRVGLDPHEAAALAGEARLDTLSQRRVALREQLLGLGDLAVGQPPAGPQVDPYPGDARARPGGGTVEHV